MVHLEQLVEDWLKNDQCNKGIFKVSLKAIVLFLKKDSLLFEMSFFFIK